MAAVIPLLFVFACEDPPPPPAPVLRLVVQPADALVRLDGAVLPPREGGEGIVYDGPVHPGSHTVEVQRKGFLPVQRDVVLELGDNSVETISLAPTEIAVKVSSHPPGARVLVGGEALGVTPFAGTLPAGPLHLVVSMDGKNDEHTRVFLDEPLTVDAWMDPEGQLFDLVRIFPTGHLPKGLAITPDNQQVWVASLGGWV